MTVLYSPIPDREHPEQIYCLFPSERSGAFGSYLQTQRAGNCTGGGAGAGAAAGEKEEGDGRGEIDTLSIVATRGRFVNISSAADFIVSLAVVLRTSFTPFMNCERRAGPSLDIPTYIIILDALRNTSPARNCQPNRPSSCAT
jgi:hypothetical protein